MRDVGGSAKFSNEISWELFLLFNISTLQHSNRVYFQIFILSIGNYSKLKFFLLREVNFIDRISSSGNKPVCWLFLYLTSLKCVSPHFGHLLEKFTSFLFVLDLFYFSLIARHFKVKYEILIGLGRSRAWSVIVYKSEWSSGEEADTCTRPGGRKVLLQLSVSSPIMRNWNVKTCPSGNWKYKLKWTHFMSGNFK